MESTLMGLGVEGFRTLGCRGPGFKSCGVLGLLGFRGLEDPVQDIGFSVEGFEGPGGS